jgi:hypothetical protein
MVVIGIMPQDVTSFGLKKTEKVAEKMKDLVLGVVAELKSGDIQPEKRL